MGWLPNVSHGLPPFKPTKPNLEHLDNVSNWNQYALGQEWWLYNCSEHNFKIQHESCEVQQTHRASWQLHVESPCQALHYAKVGASRVLFDKENSAGLCQIKSVSCKGGPSCWVEKYLKRTIKAHIQVQREIKVHSLPDCNKTSGLANLSWQGLISIRPKYLKWTPSPHPVKDRKRILWGVWKWAYRI